MNAVALPPELMALLDVRQTIGVTLAICGNLVISIGLALTKHAHNINQNRPTPLPYVKVPLWWLGFLATVIGEIGNFASYGFTQASVVAPLGAVSVLANVFIATCWLGEGLGARKVIGCGLCIIGGFIIVMSRPQSSVTLDIDTFIKNVQDRIFAIYMVLLTAVVLLLVGFQDKYGHRYVFLLSGRNTSSLSVPSTQCWW